MPSAPARILDLTRLVSRTGSGPPTGIDRVERAYLDRFIADSIPAFGLVRIGRGFFLLDRQGMIGLRNALDEGRAPANVSATIERLAIARGPISAFLLRRHVPRGSGYFNVGHSNLSRWRLRAIRKIGRCRVTVLVHDVIPLLHPDLSRDGVAAGFRKKMKAIAAEADGVICASDATRVEVETALAKFGRVPPIIIAPLGIDLAEPDPSTLPDELMERPFFLALGTIEPRKDHGFLLDLWEEMHRSRPAEAIPRLVIAGRRGWRNAELFRRLDNLPFIGSTVVECPGLTDGAVAALLDRATALLFPSIAEGFGLPPIEAAARGCPVLCLPLPVYRETLDDYPVYLKQGDRYSWLETMDGLIREDRQRGRGPGRGSKNRRPPEWESHFNRALSWSH